MTTAPATWEFAQTFTANFQATRAELHSQIEAAGQSPSSTALQDLAAGVARLSKSLVDATGSLPKYDQGLYENQVKELEERIEALRSRSSSKPRFSFKRKTPASTPTPPPPIPSSSAVLGQPVKATEVAPSTRNLTLESRQYAYIDASDLNLSESTAASPDLSISDLSHCIVNLLPLFNQALSSSSSSSDAEGSTTAPFGAYHIRNLTNCIVLLPFCPGSALIHELRNCSLALGCHQFRMHNSTSTDIYLDITSNPIIEGCSRIRFAMYPSKLNPDLLKRPPLPSLTIQDFSHIRSTTSPNFTLMSDKLAIESQRWPLDTRIESKEEVEKALQGLLPGESVES
ncbi:tubulin binding cofactor C-domain-containing protein [Coprinopsis sp. MPI-PUGE-AT-0042]|nr:tubulin binding cofactor C-domain-containing protein [Coprinopsis sp. MPI-PUGE-AT-0042]